MVGVAALGGGRSAHSGGPAPLAGLGGGGSLHAHPPLDVPRDRVEGRVRRELIARKLYNQSGKMGKKNDSSSGYVSLIHLGGRTVSHSVPLTSPVFRKYFVYCLE